MKSTPTIQIEKEYQSKGYAIIAGLDEAGKGSWAGPVVSAAVILPEETDLPGLNDSKLVTEKKRDKLFDLIQEQAIAIGLGIIENTIIDELGLGEAHRFSMRTAIINLKQQVDIVLVDGSGIKNLGAESTCIVKGDQKVRCIAAASIIAKVTRDRIMKECETSHPGYGFAQHKGYGTKMHREALEEKGACKIHRFSYEPIRLIQEKRLV